MTPRESTGYCFCYVVDRALSERFFSVCFEEEDTVIDVKWVVKEDALWNLHSLVSCRRLLSNCERVRDLFKWVYNSIQPANKFEEANWQVRRAHQQNSAKTNSAEPKRTPDGFYANTDNVVLWPGSRHVCIWRTRTPSLLPSMWKPRVFGPTITL